MATKLKNLRIRKVDFVDEGANPDAHIGMYKHKEGEGRETGFDGGKEAGRVLKKLFGFIGRAAGMSQGEIDNAVDEIQKGSSMSFMERINAVNTGKIADEIWDICYALQSSFCSILNDEDLDSAGVVVAMQESLDEFYAVIKESIAKWSSGKVASIIKKEDAVSATDLEVMKSAVARLNRTIEKAGNGAMPGGHSGEGGQDNNENPKGDEEEMKIDKSKLTDAERAFLESIEKRYGTDDGAAQGNGGTTAPVPAGQVQNPVVPSSAPSPAGQAVNKSLAQPAAETAPDAQDDGADGIYKGLHPAVRAELESLKKFREDTEAKELADVAKRYAIIGKKEEELVPLFKSLKAAGGTAYNDMIAVLDQAVAAVEKSGVFSEIGKSGHGSVTASTAETKAETIAKGYMEKDPSLDYAAAMAKAWEDNPDLMAEYETEAGF